MAFICKKVGGVVASSQDVRCRADAVQCKKAFRKDMTTYEEADEYCPHCDNHYVSGIFLWSAGRMRKPTGATLCSPC